MKKEVVIWGIFIMVLLAGLSACEKDPGEGGTSTITGALFVLDYNSNGILKDSFYAPDEKVFITYGDHEVVDDETSTSFDGKFEFDYLYKGEYTIFAYSKCDTCASGTEPIIQTIEITDRGTTYELPRLTIRD